MKITQVVCYGIMKSLSRVQLFATPWSIAHQAPLSMGFSMQEYWSGLPLLSPEDLLNPGIEPSFPALVGWFFTPEPTGNPLLSVHTWVKLNSQYVSVTLSNSTFSELFPQLFNHRNFDPFILRIVRCKKRKFTVTTILKYFGNTKSGNAMWSN